MHFSMGVTPCAPKWAWGKSQAPGSTRDPHLGPQGQLADGFIKSWVLLRAKPWQEPGWQGSCVSDLQEVFLVHEGVIYFKEIGDKGDVCASCHREGQSLLA